MRRDRYPFGAPKVISMPDLRRDIQWYGQQCEAALHRAAMFEDMGHPRTAGISRERAMNYAHAAEISARCMARFESRDINLEHLA